MGIFIHSILTTAASRSTSVLVNTHHSLYPVPEFDRYYVAYVKADPTKEPLSTGESIPRTIADAAAKTGRSCTDFEVEEISRERYEKLRQFLSAV